MILLFPLIPLLIEFRSRVLLAISLGLVALTGWSFSRAVSTPPFSEQAPQQINLIYVEEEGVPQARLVLQALEGHVPGSLAANLPDSETVAGANVIAGLLKDYENGSVFRGLTDKDGQFHFSGGHTCGFSAQNGGADQLRPRGGRLGQAAWARAHGEPILHGVRDVEVGGGI